MHPWPSVQTLCKARERRFTSVCKAVIRTSHEFCVPNPMRFLYKPVRLRRQRTCSKEKTTKLHAGSGLEKKRLHLYEGSPRSFFTLVHHSKVVTDKKGNGATVPASSFGLSARVCNECISYVTKSNVPSMIIPKH